jgi:acyl-coenzyme A synthetase/AMP-(fatty) acid ligase
VHIDRVGGLADHAAEAWGEHEFARLGDTSISFAGMRRWSDAIAAELLRRGVNPGDRVMILMVNRLDVIAVTMAAWRIGAVAVPVVAIYRTHELGEIVADVRPAAVVTTVTQGQRGLTDELDHCFAVAGLNPARYIADTGEAAAGWLPLPQQSADTDAALSWSEPSARGDECLRLYTSGSTSAPKGVRLNSTSVIFGGRQFADRLGIGTADTGLALAPVAHIAGLLAACIVPLTCGAGAVILPRWEVGHAVDAIDRHHITWSLGAAVFLRDLVEEYERRRAENLHVLSFFVSGGANTAPDLIKRADALGMWAARTYGMTEAAGVVTLAPRDASLHRRAYWDGKLADNAEARVLGEDGTSVDVETEGVITLRGTQFLLGYTDEALNAEQFDDDGWFDPEDRGLVSADGWMRITGRTKDIINRGGEKFSAADIENVLHRHPDVAKAAVLGVPHERLGESVCAFVQTRSGRQPDAGDLAAFMTGQDITRAKVPTEWHFVDEIPTTASGKVQKHLLRAHRESVAARPQSTPATATKGRL